jgi:hypothetical protein
VPPICDTASEDWPGHARGTGATTARQGATDAWFPTATEGAHARNHWLIDRMDELMPPVWLDPLRYEPIPLMARMRSAAGTLGASFTFEPGLFPSHPRILYQGLTAMGSFVGARPGTMVA